MPALAAELGEVDLLMVLSAGYFRMRGCSSMAALLPYSDANRLTWEVTTREILPRLTRTPVFVGVCAQAPDLDPSDFLGEVSAHGLAGITNFPSVGFIDGRYRAALEDAGLGYAREVELLRAAHEAGLMTIAFCFTADEAVAMARAGADVFCLDLGFADWRASGPEEHQAALDRAVNHITGVMLALREVRPNPYAVAFGGPVLLAQDTAQVYQRTEVLGYIGGSTIERFPAAPLITQSVREFRHAAHVRRQSDRLGAMIGASSAMQEVFDTIRHVARTDAPVMIVGESGTGKELAAREIHRLSRRCERPLVCWNCGATAEGLAMSELFGHERGAFTGASSRRLGKFEQADGATLFMDEVTDLSPSVQASLLRVLQEREIIRVGGEETIPVDVRLIAATNRDLQQEVREQRFRLDLYYRLSTVVLRIPPLRERREDIPLLVWELVHELSERYGLPVPSIPGPVMDELTRHSWPGNIRELRIAVERCLILGQGEPFDLHWLRDMLAMAEALQGASGTSFQQSAADPNTEKRRRLLAVLARHNGNKSAAARELGVTRKTVYDWVARLESDTVE
jgi:DNA-binding NtrC family response regulator/predicted TIM-barrel enzyme